MPKEVIHPNIKTVANAPYSLATKVGGTVYLSGMVPFDSAGNLVGKGDIAAQTRQVLSNIRATVEAAGGTLKDIVKTTVYLSDLTSYAAMNAVYAEFFAAEPPARTTLRADLVSADFLVEIESIAVLS